MECILCWRLFLLGPCQSRSESDGISSLVFLPRLSHEENYCSTSDTNPILCAMKSRLHLTDGVSIHNLRTEQDSTQDVHFQDSRPFTFCITGMLDELK